jgi:hypothetical protein
MEERERPQDLEAMSHDELLEEFGVPGAVSGKCTVRVMTEERSPSGYISFVRENNHFGG